MLRNKAMFFGLSLVLGSISTAYAETGVFTAPDGERLLLCGSGDKARLSERLRSDPSDFFLESSRKVDQRFEIAYPDGFPASYWGIDKELEAYVCLGVNRFHDSSWQLPTLSGRTGAFRQFVMQVFGFKTDAAGNRLDANGDGVADDMDWISLDYLQAYAGKDRRDARAITSAMRASFGSRAEAAAIALPDASYDSEGYPHRLTVRTLERGAYFEAKVSKRNRFDCTGAWEQCYVFGEFMGSDFFATPSPAHGIGEMRFRHSGNKWLKFDATRDTYAIHDPGLRALLQRISFKPEFWALSKDNRFDLIPR